MNKLKLTFQIFSILLLFLLISGISLASDEKDADFLTALTLLSEKSFKKKKVAIEKIEETGHEKSVFILKRLFAGELVYRKSDKKIFIGEKNSEGYLLYNVLTEDKLEQVGRRVVKKVSINNKIRRQIKSTIARLSLNNPDVEKRLIAVNEMLDNISTENGELLRAHLTKESDEEVIALIDTALALLDIEAEVLDERINAIRVLADSLHPIAKNKLEKLLLKDDEGKFLEANSEVRAEVKKSLDKIATRLKMYSFLETLFFGLSLGSVLLLAGIGLAITFGVMGVINMAHGELIMLGAYTTYVVQLLMPDSIEYSLLVAVPAAFLVSGLVGIMIERGVLRYLYGRPLETLLATFGISLILQQLVRTVFSPLNRAVESPEWMSGVLEINSALSITYNRLYIIIFSLMVFFMLIMILKKTPLGLYIRAVSQNRSMAKAMGVRSEWVDALTFGLGSGIAGVAGVALSQLTNVGPNLGQAYIIDSFMVVVFGGVGNLWGTFVGAMSLGVVNKFLEPWSGAVLAKILVLVFIILFIQKRPKGLFPQKGRAAEN